VDLTTQVDLSEALLRWEMVIHANVVSAVTRNDLAMVGIRYTQLPLRLGSFHDT